MTGRARLPYARESVESIPSAPGVYVFLDAREKPVYVGKALDLRSRVRSYFGAGDGRLVSRLLDSVAVTIDYLVTESEREALILENSLIKREKPRLNIRLTDDKTYFFLRLDRKEEWPRLRIVRRKRAEDALHFGPYTSAQACRRTIQFLSKVFPLRTCPDSVLNNRTRPCMLHEIGRCCAPCVGLVGKDSYAGLVERTVRFLSGQDQEIVRDLKAEMEAAAGRLHFERAAEIRDRLAAIQKTIDQPRVARGDGAERDVVGVHESETEVVLSVLEIRDGLLGGSHHFRFRRLGGLDEVLAAFLGQHYGPGRRPPAEILLPGMAADIELHRDILEEKRGASIDLRVPERGEGLRLLRLAEANAGSWAESGRKDREEAVATRRRLMELLGLAVEPSRIECFDISHQGGEQVVGSQVCLVDGEPERAGYRHYRLREVQRNDDFAAMREVLGRRLRRGLSEGGLPDLILIDGGPPQLQRVLEAVAEEGAAGIAVAALAKARREKDARGPLSRHERVWLPGRHAPIVLDPIAPESRWLIRARDEAHRFAISHSRRLKAKQTITTVLELVPGIGRRRAKALLAAFGSVAGVRRADRAAILEVPGMNARTVDALLEWMRDHPGADAGLAAP